MLKKEIVFFKDSSYKNALIFAAILHLLLIFFLIYKFDLSANHYAANLPSNEIIQAVLVDNPKTLENHHIIERTVREKVLQKKFPPEPAEKLYVTKKSVADIRIKKINKNVLQENLQNELALEARRLKAMHAMHQQKVELEKSLAYEIASESKNLKQSIQMQEDHSAIDKYKSLILKSIASNWILPDNVNKNARCLLLVNVAPGGVVLNVTLLESSGNLLLDRSAETAVLKSSPLPVPEDSRLFNEFRTIKLTVRPEGINGFYAETSG